MDFSKQEKQILKFWKSIQAFEKSVSMRPKRRSFVFYEGPPTANGKPGLHSVEARAFKDIICRYKTMQGFRVERRAGWDTHGLPVEVEVEKELGFKNKKDIERYGIAKFNEKCRQSVWRYKQEWEQLTERMGFWIDMSDAYITYDPLYIETLWWILSEAWKKKLLYDGHKVVPMCTRCGTSLSSHEVAQGYQDVTDNSVFIKFKIKNLKANKLKPSTYFLVWTTTPWTLPGNVALAVKSDVKYVVVKQSNEHYILAEARLEVLEGDYKVVGSMQGKDLENMEYEPLFDSFILKDLKSSGEEKTIIGNKFFVVSGDFVTTDEGTGIVHIAPMYGEDDYQIGIKFNFVKAHTVNEDGTFNKLVKKWQGKPAKESDPAIITDLKSRGLLYRIMSYKHSYPFCWRCKSPLIYYATHSWFLKITSQQDELIKANKKINWVPAHLKEGRFGEWISDLKDWNLSRSRYWGTPLPIWRCNKCNNIEVIGSRDELAHATEGNNEYMLLRHGYSERNYLNVLNGAYPEKGKRYHLRPKGIKQIIKVARELKNKKIDLIIASPITRTRETAEIVAEALGLEVKYEKKLLEIGAGIYEGRLAGDYHKKFATTQVRFSKAPRGGETLQRVQARMLNVFDALEKKYKGKRIIIISHGDPLWLLESAMLGLSIDEMAVRREKNYPQPGELRHINYAKFPYNKSGELDFHRPYVDEITFACSNCQGGISVREKYLADVWFDAGSMPYAAWHYPFENKEKIDTGESYPADYISEAVDQTRGWFYNLLAVSSILGFLKKGPTFKNVISLGLMLDERGQKMSKSSGNTVDPMELAERYSMDAVRWYFFTINGPGDVKRFAERDVKERQTRFISTLWNSYIFLNTYAANIKVQKRRSSNVLDIWIFARLKQVTNEVTSHLDKYHVVEAARALDDFVMRDLSNWYVRRSRGRLARPNSKKEHKEAVDSFAFVLNEVVKLAAPFIPFLSESIWQKLNGAQNKSVHWENLPKYKALTKYEKDTLEAMAHVREWAEVGLRMRGEAGIRVRQPLKAFTVPGILPQVFKKILAEELNVKEIVKGKKLSLDTKLTPKLITEGQVREMVRHIQDMRKSAGLKPQNKIRIYYSLPQIMRGKLNKHIEKIASDTNAVGIQERKVEGRYLAISSFKWDGKHEIKIAIKKVK